MTDCCSVTRSVSAKRASQTKFYICMLLQGLTEQEHCVFATVPALVWTQPLNWSPHFQVSSSFSSFKHTWLASLSASYETSYVKALISPWWAVGRGRKCKLRFKIHFSDVFLACCYVLNSDKCKLNVRVVAICCMSLHEFAEQLRANWQNMPPLLQSTHAPKSPGVKAYDPPPAGRSRYVWSCLMNWVKLPLNVTHWTPQAKKVPMV